MDQAAFIGTLCSALLRDARRAGLPHLSVSRTHEGHPAGILHASDDSARRLIELQESLSEGLTILAMQESRPVFVGDLATDPRGSRWVAFRGEAAALGVGSVFVFPLQVGAVRLGALMAQATGRGAPG